ncbi:LpqB family beta-propeller domain-containing protein [Homoserinibacter sp. GY 40078]|uniref:LpqB family beta-propeller domain-containing protein n=1 Tax=Homoserinibacter sp. GY 40078 TaxID=2603275 RepID=UPI0011CB1C92|nr:LpqB family beta-propeller domain-containing protein [Homoserinibacter sp. GY 40078]TXK16296.1 hypothetical protein FVQ89_13645 [Homoserinibacter sp. GY 40078]
MSGWARTSVLRSAGVALVAALLLAGCAGIPNAGPVGSEPIGADQDGDDLISLPEGPQTGATPDELLLGFLRAQRSPKNDFIVARDYLTDEFRTEWRPTSNVLISDTAVVPVAVDEDSYTVSVRVDAVVGAHGDYADLAEPQNETLAYEFAKNADGEWRISSAPDGSLLPSGRFTVAFSASPLYYFDPSYQYLVPDLRWFPDTPSRADRIVTELLRGQSDWYGQGVLVTAFPAGSAVESVQVANGVATVDLSGDIATQPELARWRMQQQLAASLATLTDSSSVQLTADGFAVTVGDRTSVDRVLAVSQKTLGGTGDAFGFLARDAVETVPGLSRPVQGLDPHGATLARDAESAAVRADDGAWLVEAGDDPLRVDGRSNLIDPGIDDLDYVWTVPADEPSAIVATGADGVPHPVSAPFLDGTARTLDVSREGARLLVATRVGDTSAVWMIGIVRDADGVPTGLGTPLQLVVRDAPLIDAAWVDASTIAVLSGSDGESQVELYRIGGRAESFGALDGGVQIVGGNTADGIRVRDADGDVWRRTSSGGWQSTGIVASFLGTQQ